MLLSPNMSGATITWFVPFPAHRKAALAELRRVFSILVLVRITLVFSAIFLLVRHALLHAFPGIEANWTEVYLTCIASMFALVGMGFLVALIPQGITVAAKGVFVQNGQSGAWHLYKDMAAIRVDESATPLPVLRISFQSGRAEATYPISPSVPLEDLQALIARYRFGTNGSSDGKAP